jgi:hypothetical protein
MAKLMDAKQNGVLIAVAEGASMRGVVIGAWGAAPISNDDVPAAAFFEWLRVKGDILTGF